MTDRTGGAHFTNSWSLPKIPDFEFIASTKQYVKLGIEVKTVDETVSVKRRHELAFFEWNTVNFVGGGADTKVGVDRVEDKISWVMRDSGFVMGSILCVYLNGTIDLGHGDFTVVIAQDGKSDDFAVESSETF